jgi:hypothetical protein
MLVVPRPGGTIRDVNVVLKPDETLPNKFNTPQAIVWREDEANPREWVLVKPLHQTLPANSSVLSQPEMPGILDLTKEESSGSIYEHVDIIRFDSEDK